MINRFNFFVEGLGSPQYKGKKVEWAPCSKAILNCQNSRMLTTSDVTWALLLTENKANSARAFPCYCKKQTDGSFLGSLLLQTIK